MLAFSHFVPRAELLAGCFESFRHVMGSRALQAQSRALAPLVHVFGHSHLDADELVGGTRFVQHALGHPHDRHGQQVAAASGPLVAWAAPDGHDGDAPGAGLGMELESATGAE